MTLEEFSALAASYANAPYEQLVDAAKEACLDIIPAVIGACGEEEDAVGFMMDMLGVAIGADGVLSEAEERLVRDVMADSMELSGFGGKDPVGEAQFNAFADGLPPAAKTAVCVFCACLLAVDRDMTASECRFLAKLID